MKRITGFKGVYLPIALLSIILLVSCNKESGGTDPAPPGLGNSNTGAFDGATIVQTRAELPNCNASKEGRPIILYS